MKFLAGYILGLIITGLVISWLDTTFESNSCNKLQEELNVVLVYSYNKGCHLPK